MRRGLNQMMIVGTDNLNRETVADKLVTGGVPQEQTERAQEFCDWLNTFTCHDHGGTFYCLKPNDYRLSRGMEDLAEGKTMNATAASEFEDAIRLANRVLDEPGRDPDDDISMMSRQFLRDIERTPPRQSTEAMMKRREPMRDSCPNCDGEGVIYMCVSEYACVDPEEGCDLCERPCDWCRPRPSPPTPEGN